MNQAPASPSPLNLRPNPLFADITLIESRGTSRYNALQVRYQQRPAHGMSVLMAYTLGKSTDDASGFFTSAGDPNFPQNSLDPAAERGPSSFDIRHRFSAGAIMPVPFGTGQPMLANQGWLSKALADMEVRRGLHVSDRPALHRGAAARRRQQQHRPIQPRVRQQRSAQRQRRHVAADAGTADEWFDTAAFSMPAFGTFGNSGRNAYRGPGLFEPQRRAGEADPLRADAATVELRLEAFNLFNRINYDLPDAFFGSPTFGRILSAQESAAVSVGGTGGVLKLNGSSFLILRSSTSFSFGSSFAIRHVRRSTDGPDSS